MKIKTSVSLGEIETEVSISTEDIIAAIGECEPEDRVPRVLLGINHCAQFLKSVSDEHILKMGDAQKKVVADFLTEQASRYRAETQSKEQA